MTFQVIPAVDLLGGRCVRLLQGDYTRETTYSDDPVAVARQWAEEGAPLIHVVDLDGARAGHPAQSALIAEICRAVPVNVEVSGGMRRVEDIAAALEYGAHRVQIGSAAVKDPKLVKTAVERFGDAITVSLDARDGLIQTDGWLQGSTVRAIDLAKEMAAAGVARLMFTDIGRDGMLSEPNYGAYEELIHAVDCAVVASGGISRVDQLRQLADIGCEGCIVGKALYEGSFTYAEAVAAAVATG